MSEQDIAVGDRIEYVATQPGLTGMTGTVTAVKRGWLEVVRDDNSELATPNTANVRRIDKPKWADLFGMDPDWGKPDPAADGEHVHVCVTCAATWDGEKGVTA